MAAKKQSKDFKRTIDISQKVPAEDALQLAVEKLKKTEPAFAYVGEEGLRAEALKRNPELAARFAQQSAVTVSEETPKETAKPEPQHEEVQVPDKEEDVKEESAAEDKVEQNEVEQNEVEQDAAVDEEELVVPTRTQKAKSTKKKVQQEKGQEKEKKRPFGIVLLPSMYADMKNIAYMLRMPLASIVSSLFAEYIEANKKVLEEYDKLKKQKS